MRPLRILHLLSQRPDSTGSGIYLQAMLTAAAERGHTNAMVAGIQNDRPVTPSGVAAPDCHFVRFGSTDFPEQIVGMSDVMPYESRRFGDLTPAAVARYEAAFSRQLQLAIDSFQPDLIHSHHLWLVTALARRCFPQIPVVTNCHGSDLRQFRNCSHLRERVGRCRTLDAVLALSTSQKGEIAALYGIEPAKIHVVGAGYNDRRFFPVAKATPEPVRLLYAGKLSRAKGIPWLLRALSAIAITDWHLDLVGGGSGPEKAECLRLAEAIGDRVTIHGALPQNELADLMGQAHLFVLPSFFEGMPLVLLEALASGCRVVSTRLPGVNELVGNLDSDAVSLVDLPRLEAIDQPHPDDSARFVTNLGSALAEQIEAARGGHPVVTPQIADRLSRFTWPRVFARIEPIYRAAISHHRSA
ncbi:MAG: glycosyltransferase family 4 protein [Desulfosarcinaceae bacterium]|nr:glycosyltransferase family 4 protein [Desulfosarcinaceae bacterium]